MIIRGCMTIYSQELKQLASAKATSIINFCLLSSNQRMYQPLTYHQVSLTLQKLIIHMK
jgi:hypothetical protein